METKALKRQMGAAIAMVLVAAIALAASTYAWFVSNNQVKATTASVSAQSNSPFLKIDTKKNGITTDSPTAVTFATTAKTLYPSQVVNGTNAPLFESAYASAADSPTELGNSRYEVGGIDAAVKGEYAYGEEFMIGTASTEDKAGSFKDLKVASVALSDPGKMNGENGLKDAISVLVVCGDKWGVYKVSTDGALVNTYSDNKTTVSGNVGSDTDANALAGTIAAGDSVDVSIYVFYDGSATNVTTNNINNLNGCGVTVTFSATPVSPDNKEIAGNNFVERTNAGTVTGSSTTGGEGGGNDVAGKDEATI